MEVGLTTTVILREAKRPKDLIPGTGVKHASRETLGSRFFRSWSALQNDIFSPWQGVVACDGGRVRP